MAEDYVRDELEKLTVAELKELLAERELPTKGKKDNLVARLLGSGEDVEQRPVTRRTERAWWCPFCDYSTFILRGNRPGLPDDHVCGGCGAVATEDYNHADPPEVDE